MCPHFSPNTNHPRWWSSSACPLPPKKVPLEKEQKARGILVDTDKTSEMENEKRGPSWPGNP